MGGLSATVAVARRSITGRAGRASRSAASPLTEPWRKPFSPLSSHRAAEHAREDRKRDREVVALKLEQARYEAERARRQYDAAEPENRLVAAELERRWNRALEVVGEVEREWVAFEAGECRKDERIDRAALPRLAKDSPGVWHDADSDMRLKKRIVRTLIEVILVDVDEESARIQMIVRWAGGQHTQLSVRKQRTGQRCHTTDRKVVEIVRELAAMVPDGQIARILNLLGLRTGQSDGGPGHQPAPLSQDPGS